MSDPTESDPGGQENEPTGAFPPLSGALSIPGLGELLGGARQHFEQAAHEAGDVKVKGSAGGGAVEIELTGNLDVVAVRIDPAVIDRDDPSLLEDLVTAALRDALSEVVSVRQEAVTGLLPPGMDLGAMMSGIFGPEAGQAAGALPDLSGIDLGGLDFGELMGGLFGAPEDGPDENDGPDESDGPDEKDGPDEMDWGEGRGEGRS